MTREARNARPALPADQRGSRDAAAGAAEPGPQRLPGDARWRHAALACRAASRGRVEIDVEDTGVGIAPENLEKIFDLYFTTKEKGSGIGLSMVYRIVQLHDGEVEVQSTPGRGTQLQTDFSTGIDDGPEVLVAGTWCRCRERCC